MMRRAVLGVTERSVTRRMVTGTRPGRALARRFVAGETLEEAVEAAKELNAAGMKVSLDYLGEHVDVIDEAEAATQSYLECIAAIKDTGIDANISVKLTQLGMGLDDDVARSNLDRLAVAGLDAGCTVTVDMEESDFTETTIQIFETVQTERGNLGIALQAYLHRTADDLERIMPAGGHIRLCKGAYAEPDSIAFQGHAVDSAFDDLAETLMANGMAMPAIATHDDARIAPVLDAVEDREGPWEFQMLYGVRRDRQEELVAEGHQVRVYVPYGDAWYPYLTRRLAERPANVKFFLRALVGG